MTAGSGERTAPTLRQRLREELKTYWIITLYLWLFLGLFTVYRRLVLAETGTPYLHYGLALVEAMIIAKVVLVGRMLGFIPVRVQPSRNAVACLAPSPAGRERAGVRVGAARIALTPTLSHKWEREHIQSIERGLVSKLVARLIASFWFGRLKGDRAADRRRRTPTERARANFGARATAARAQPRSRYGPG